MPVSFEAGILIGYSPRGGAKGGFGRMGAGTPVDDLGSGVGILAEPNADGAGASAPDCCGSGAGARASPGAVNACGAGFAPQAFGVPTTVSAILPLSVFRTKL